MKINALKKTINLSLITVRIESISRMSEYVLKREELRKGVGEGAKAVPTTPPPPHTYTDHLLSFCYRH